ncbi:MAG: hypothetical protein OXG77_09390 [Chloroflexi bacterium]|nr:hypothetical protein [Chloroflexota bacterium]
MNLLRPLSGRRPRSRSLAGPPAGDPAPALRGLLGSAAARLRRLEVAANLPRATAVPLAATALALPAWQLQLEALAVLVLALGAGWAAWNLAPAFSAPDAVAVAHRLDRANALDDLLASALTVDRSEPGMVAELHRRAGERAAGIAPRSVGGWRLDRGGVAALGLALVLVGMSAALVIERDRAATPATVADLATDSAQAARQTEALEAARAELAGALDPAAEARATGLEELARTFAEDPATRDAGRAMASGDAAGAAAELSQLGERLSDLTALERANLQSTLEEALAESAADPLLAGPLEDARDALSEHRLASAANALGELGEALQSTQAQLASQSELRERMEELEEQLGGGASTLQPATSENPGPPSGGGDNGSGEGSVERIRTDGAVELVPLNPESDPASLQPRPLELGIETEPGRNPSAGLLGFTRTAPATRSPAGIEDDQLLRSYIFAADDE